jgi:hypothetical protein
MTFHLPICSSQFFIADYIAELVVQKPGIVGMLVWISFINLFRRMYLIHGRIFERWCHYSENDSTQADNAHLVNAFPSEERRKIAVLFGYFLEGGRKTNFSFWWDLFRELWGLEIKHVLTNRDSAMTWKKAGLPLYFSFCGLTDIFFSTILSTPILNTDLTTDCLPQLIL